ncbi:MAG: hypothetical protein WC091_23520 [Sulfuricellaceae bacterium]
MSAITFDTLKFAERLEKAGIPREHAKAALQDEMKSRMEKMQKNRKESETPEFVQPMR